MRFEILNVGHGFCACLVADNRNLLVVDRGHRGAEFRPSLYLHGLGQRSTERLFITNYDEDHISDLPNVRRLLPVQLLHRNKTITSEALRGLKLEGGPITPAMQELISMMSTYTGPETDPPDFPRVSWETFAAKYGLDFDDTNNLSMVVFLECGELGVLIPGDLEEAGWRYHLRNQYFRQMLSRVHVFIASHHGRESGYCPDVFDHCSPTVIVLSDSEIVHGTQQMASAYAEHATGINFNGETRYVLSTRSDGAIEWRDL